MNQAITAVAFIHKDGKLFTARRAASKNFLPGKFELPGGHIEPGEDIVAGLRRELREELDGLEVIIGDPFYAFTYTNDTAGTHSVEIAYFAQLKNPEGSIHLKAEDHSESAWITAVEVDRYWAGNDDERTLVERGFAILRQGGTINV